MIEGIVLELAERLATLPWLTRIGGLARAQKVNDDGRERTLPIARGIVPAPQGDNPFIWMQPDGCEAGIAYFELVSDTPSPSSQPPRRLDEIATVRLVGWVNLQRLNPPDAEVAAMNVLAKIPASLPDTAMAQMVWIELLGFEVKTPAIFSRYTYDEKELQHLMWPFDYFSIVFQVRYTIIPGAAPVCVDAVELLPAPC